ncbi:DNA topoisomerase I (EC [uncultured Gammaproteobacteria bacterium]|nr:DNA topoisomerase I (EC [uncultured Gammaproteobacteria bacterium]
MPKKDMGVDIENNFEPTYEVTADKKKVVAQLRKDVKAADKNLSRTDEDREGEAIAWHLLEALNLPKTHPELSFMRLPRCNYRAITEPRIVDYNLVDAQQARRIIDRLVGFEISPVLWRKISGARSAGRVQSPVVRLVVEREREIIDHTCKKHL